MTDVIRIEVTTFCSAPKKLAATGLIGWLSCRYGRLELSGLALRRTKNGRLALSFPARTDAAGKRRPYIRPMGDDARREIEVQVFAALGLEAGEEAPR